MKKNNFRDEKKIKTPSFTKDEFPELSKKNNTMVVETNMLSYATTTKKEIQDETKTKNENDDLQPGWLKIYKDTNGNIVKEFVKSKHRTKPNPITFHLHAVRHINQMKKRWEKYKDDYIESWGEDSYEQLCENENHYEENEDFSEEEYYSDDKFDYNLHVN